MSYFDDASLVMIPSGYKDQKVYSVKPLDGTGDLTFSRASSATRVASNGLIEKVRTNLALYSEQFDNAAYTKTDATVTANAVANPLNGAVTADKIVENTASSLHRVGQGAISVTSGVPITFSFIAKAGERTQLEVQRINTSGTVFNVITNNIINLTTGVVPAITGATNYGSVSLGDGWFRYYITLTPIASGSGGLNLGLVDGSGNVSYTGDGTSGAFVFGFQAEVGDIATQYIATTSAAVSVGPVSGLPRLDYLNSTCPRLLLEPQRTNLLVNSEVFSNWTLNGATITSNSLTAPDGYTSADTLTGSTGSFRIYQLVGGLSSIDYTFSVFAKKGTAAKVWFDFVNVADGPSFDFDTKTWSTVSGWTTNYQELANGWFRLIATKASNTSSAGLGIKVGAAGETAYIWGAQMEAGAYATSYIPTTSAAVTRLRDTASKTSISSLIGQTEGTLFVEFNSSDLQSYTQRIITLSDSTTNNVIGFQLTGANQITFYVENGGVNQVAITKSAPAITLGQNVKLAAAYKANDFVLYLNGVQVGTDTSGSVPATSALRYSEANDSAPYIGKIVQTLLFKTRLSNSDLAALTA